MSDRTCHCIECQRDYPEPSELDFEERGLTDEEWADFFDPTNDGPSPKEVQRHDPS